MPEPAYLLDTTILLHWVRDTAQARTIDLQFQLTQSRRRPLICEVSVGELLAFSRSLKWGSQKQQRLKDIVERETVIVRISGGRRGCVGADIDYAPLTKIDGNGPDGEKRYSPAKCLGCETKIVTGDPNPKHLDQLRRAPESHDADVDAQVYAP